MITASIIYRAHVPGVSSRLDREPVAVRTCARLRWRAHSDILAKRTTPPATLSAAQNPTPKTGGGNWSRTVELTPAPVRLLFQFVAGRTRDIMRPAFPTLGTVWSGVCNFCRTQPYTAGKCFLFCSVALCSPFKLLQEPNGVESILLRPNPFVAPAHESNVPKGLCHERQVSCKR